MSPSITNTFFSAVILLIVVVGFLLYKAHETGIAAAQHSWAGDSLGSRMGGPSIAHQY